MNVQITTNDVKRTTVRISKSLHLQWKIYAAEKALKMDDIAEKALKEYLNNSANSMDQAASLREAVEKRAAV
jgi:hypothetical protein